MADNFNIGIIFKATDQASNTIKNIASTYQSSFKKIGLGLTAGITAPLILFGKSAIGQAIQFDTLKNSLNIFTKDIDKTKKLLIDIDQLKTELPFTEDSINRSTLALAKFRVKADEIPKAIKLIGEISAGSGMALDELSAIFGRFSTGANQGRLLMTLAKSGIPITQTLMKLNKQNAEVIEDWGNRGKITQRMIIEAFQAMSKEGGIFYESLKMKSESLDGRIIKLKNSYNNLKETIGLILTDVIGFGKNTDEVSKKISNISNSIQEFYKDAPQFTKAIIAMAGALALLGPSLGALGAFSSLLVAITPQAVAFAGALAAIVGTLGLITANYSKFSEMFNQLPWKNNAQPIFKKGSPIDKMINNELLNPRRLFKPEIFFKPVNGQVSPNTPKTASNNLDINLMLGLPDGFTLPSKRIENAVPGVNINIFSESWLGNNYDIATPRRGLA